MSNELKKKEDLEGSGCGVIEGIIATFSWRD
jgi:hypothetical protein